MSRRVEIPGSPEPGEAAAIVAAIEQFIAETAAAAEQPPAHANPWQRAALVEGISAKAAFGPTNAPRDPWP